MKTLKYQIVFFSYWHTGSGLIGGMDVNASVIKDEKGFPFIPGKTIKGLLREAAENLHELNARTVSIEFIQDVFGKKEAKDNYNNQASFFSNAGLSESISNHISQSQKQLLYDRLASTAITESGQAKDHSLRQIEVTVPLTLYGTIMDFPENEEALKAIKMCMKWIKQLGTNRTRGLGRCEFIYQN